MCCNYWLHLWSLSPRWADHRHLDLQLLHHPPPFLPFFLLFFFSERWPRGGLGVGGEIIYLYTFWFQNGEGQTFFFRTAVGRKLLEILEICMVGRVKTELQKTASREGRSMAFVFICKRVAYLSFIFYKIGDYLIYCRRWNQFCLQFDVSDKANIWFCNFF